MPEGHLWGRPAMERAIGFHVTSSLARGACRPCWETSLQDEHNLPDDTLNHDPTGGAGNGTGWPLTETLGTQVPRSPLTNLWWELCLCRLQNEPPFLFAHLKPCLAWGRAIFSPPGRGVRDVIVTMGGTQTPDMPGTKGDAWAVPTWNDQCHITFWDRLNCPPSICRNNQQECRLYKVYKRYF